MLTIYTTTAANSETTFMLLNPGRRETGRPGGDQAGAAEPARPGPGPAGFLNIYILNT